MATMIRLILLPVLVFAAQEDPLRVDYPSVIVHAKENGDFTMLSGFNGDIVIKAGPNNTGHIMFEGEDLKEIFKIALSLPPVWDHNFLYGYVGEFRAGTSISKQIKAVDPEGTTLTYSVVAGSLPPGVKLESSTGRIRGIIPDADLMYTFTVRATDQHGKFADNVFKIVVRGIDSCDQKPCQHEGVCLDDLNGFKCSCIHPYGGHTCNDDCRSNSLGVSRRHQIIPDARMSAYLPYSTYLASNGRLYGSGWLYYNTSSWLQVDLGNITDISGFQMMGCSAYSYTTRYFVSTSLDGNTFSQYTGTSTTPYSMSGGSTSPSTASIPTPLAARFVRFHPTSWYSRSGYRPCMLVDILGCYRGT